ncbi:MAG: HK97 family phage prohead protease, partial [Rhizobiales bacterium]|nr:HK97 family phage prohead protease [Hyphomicrobiales bacterium]
GLRIESVLDAADPDVQRIVPKMKRGDLDKMSFAFQATKQEWDETQEPAVRTLLELRLLDVSIVTSPAYEGTEIGLRSLQDHRNAKNNHQAAAHRVRLKMDLGLKARRA